MALMESQLALQTIGMLQSQAQRERDEVLERARRYLSNGRSADDVLNYIGHTLTNRLMHEPSSCLRRASRQERHQLLAATHSLFNLCGTDNT